MTEAGARWAPASRLLPLEAPVTSLYVSANRRLRWLTSVLAADGDPGRAINSASFVMDLQRGRKMRVEIEFKGQTAMQVYNGAQGWKLRPFLNRYEVENFTPEELKTASSQSDLDGLLIDYQTKGSNVELEGTEQVEAATRISSK